MADSIYTFDPVPANNTALDSIPYGPNQLYHNQIDNWFRALGSKLAQFVDDLGAVNTVSGTDTIAITLASGITAYATGQMFRFTAANTTTSTTVNINVNTIGNKRVRKISGGTDVDPAVGDIAAGETYLVIYRASANSGNGAWVLVGSSVAAATTSAAGIVELATNAETLAGTDTSRAVTPSTLYFPTGHLYGLTLSNNVSDATNDIDIAAGTARDGSDTANMILASALTKRLDAAWAVGTGNGGLDTGSIANTTYHVWLIKRSDTGVVDALFSTSATSPTMPSNYDYKRRIGSIVRASGAIVAFIQTGKDNVKRYEFTGGPVAMTGSPFSTMGTSAVTRTLDNVPTGVAVEAIINCGYQLNSGETAYGYLSSLDTTDIAASNANGNIGGVNNSGGSIQNFSSLNIRTNTSAQIRSRFSASSGAITLWINTKGWIDSL